MCRHSQPVDLSYLASHLSSSFIPNAVIIDATASDVPPAHYLEVSAASICSLCLVVGDPPMFTALC